MKNKIGEGAFGEVKGDDKMVVKIQKIKK